MMLDMMVTMALDPVLDPTFTWAVVVVMDFLLDFPLTNLHQLGLNLPNLSLCLMMPTSTRLVLLLLRRTLPCSLRLYLMDFIQMVLHNRLLDLRLHHLSRLDSRLSCLDLQPCLHHCILQQLASTLTFLQCPVMILMN
jgi:hypothetical protein